MFVTFVAYIVTAFALHVMSEQYYIFPWFKGKALVLSPPLSSFLWPIGLVLSLTSGLFGLFKVNDDKE